ncbi:metallopeptidase [Candidatus Gottesmanbacteria bacterium]|nr:metallopeptidase [Candidatus Gottesmanbacteria bacterium]
MDLVPAPDIGIIIKRIVPRLPFPHIDPAKITCMRSTNTTSRARARIWSFPKIWQMALKHPPHYIIEVLSEHFDHLSADDKTRVIIHELMHIPKNFSGALVPHRGRHTHIDRRSVERFFQMYKQSTRSSP